MEPKAAMKSSVDRPRNRVAGGNGSRLGKELLRKEKEFTRLP